jgi:branched-chain amino acid transport system ATP-binding protein
MSVYDNVRVGARFGHHPRHDHEEQSIRNMIHFVGLEDKAHQTVETLRLYDIKQTMLAALLATHPRLLLIDEPLGGLTPHEIRLSVETHQKN